MAAPQRMAFETAALRFMRLTTAPIEPGFGQRDSASSPARRAVRSQTSRPGRDGGSPSRSMRAIDPRPNGTDRSAGTPISAEVIPLMSGSCPTRSHRASGEAGPSARNRSSGTTPPASSSISSTATGDGCARATSAAVCAARARGLVNDPVETHSHGAKTGGRALRLQDALGRQRAVPIRDPRAVRGNRVPHQIELHDVTLARYASAQPGTSCARMCNLSQVDTNILWRW